MPALDNEILLTPQGLKRIEEELQELKNSRRRDIAEKIRQARAHGDLSENAEYDEAKKEQAILENRIGQLEATLRRARVVRREDVDDQRVGVGSQVLITDEATGEQFMYAIVGGVKESDPSRNRISYRSPVGKALYGQTVGDTVRVRLPDGQVYYRIEQLGWIDMAEEEDSTG